MFIEKDCSFSALISDRVGCSGGLILNPSWVQQIGAIPLGGTKSFGTLFGQSGWYHILIPTTFAHKSV